MVPAPAEILPAIDASIGERLTLGALRAAPVRVAPAGPALRDEIDRCCSALAERYAGRAPAEIEGLAPARELYRAFGIDPTRNRPSSEALLRRVLRSKPFPAVLNAVDVGNLCAVRFLLPIGLYDAAKLDGPVTLRVGRERESYPGIRKDEVHLAGRPVLADRAGAFGNPSSDSLRTAVTAETAALWMVVFAPRSFPAAALEAHLGMATRLIERHLAPPERRTVVESRAAA